MADFDPDLWMAKQKKTATAPTSSSSFDPDLWMAGQGKPKRESISPDSKSGALYESLQSHARRVAEATPGVGGNLAIGAERGYRRYIEPAISSLGEVAGGVATGDFRPLGRMVREAALGTYEALKPPSPQYGRDPQTGRRTMTFAQNPTLVEAQRQREARYAATPQGQYAAQRLAELDQRAGLDPSYSGKITRGGTEFITGAAPTLAAAVATRGAVLPTAAMAGLQSAGNPSQMLPQAAGAALPMPSVRPLLRRLRGKPSAVTTSPTRALDTQPLVYPDAPVTREMPGVGRTPRAEDLPTAELRAPMPDREILDRPPGIYDEPIGEFEVAANLNPPRQYAGAVGPRAITELAFQTPAPKVAAQPPIKPPDIDASLEKWARQPQQRPLFEASAKSPWQDSVLAYYRAGLLTNPAGRALDLGSTVVNQFADAAVRPVAAAVDVFVSKFTGKRSITGPSVTGSAKAFGSIRQGLRDAGEVLKTGKQTIDSGADDVLYGSEIRTGLGKVADVPINGVFRVLGAMDAPFRRFAFVRNLQDRATVAAINEAKRGRIGRDRIATRASQLVDRDDIIAAAVRDGERSVLSEPNRLSSWMSRQMQNSPNARLAVGIVQPFMRIPLNAILRSADFAGVGGVKALYKIARGVSRKAKGQSFFRDLEEQRVFAQNVAAGSFAPAAFLLGMELEDRGALEGYYFTSKSDYPNGAVPTSIEIGGERYDINRLGGFVLAPLFIGATYNRLRKQDVGEANALLRSFSGLAQQAPALGYYGAPAKAGRILTADEPGEEIIKEAGSMTSGLIPASGAAGFAAKVIDRNRNRKAEGFTGPIMNRIPGLREQLPEKARAARLDAPQGFAKMHLDPKRADKDDKNSHDESPLEFKARLERVNERLRTYGPRLVKSGAYARATAEEQKAMRDYLSRQVKSADFNAELLDPTRILGVIRESAYQKRQKELGRK